jgi:hypothetical protein
MIRSSKALYSFRQVTAGGIALFAVLFVGGAASARGVAIDQIQPASISPCALGSACSPNTFNSTYDYNFLGGDPGPPFDQTFNLGVFDKVYVYDDGVISINKPLPTGASVAGGLASLGGNYIAAGFADLAGLNSGGDFQVVGSVDPEFTPDGTALVAQTVNVEWIFDKPDGQTAILGLSLTDMSSVTPGEILVSMDSGAGAITWFGKNYPNAYCDSLCQAGLADQNGVEGVYLPNGAIIGSGFKGFGSPVVVNSDFNYPGYRFDINTSTPGVPEPATWALSILGFAIMGQRLRRRRSIRMAS